MTDSNQSGSQSDVTQPNSSEPSMTRRKGKGRTNLEGFRDSFRPAKVNPLSRDNHKLSCVGEVRRRLNLTDDQMAGVPVIVPQIRKALGSIREAVEIIRADDAVDAQKFIAVWDSVSPSDRKNGRFEDFIIAAGLTPRRFMELLAGATFDHNRMFTALSQLKVMHSTVKAATDEHPIFDRDGKIVGRTNGDVRAMEAFHKITGALPTPKPAQFNQFVQNNYGNNPEPPKEHNPLQSMDSFLLEIDDIRKPKQLSSPVIEVPVIEPENAPEIEYLPLGD